MKDLILITAIAVWKQSKTIKKKHTHTSSEVAIEVLSGMLIHKGQKRD